MANGYVESANIKMYPSGNRADVLDAQARLNTEANIINFRNGLVDSKDASFVKFTDSDLTYSSPDDSAVEFILHGYWFKTSFSAIRTAIGSTTFDSATDIWANILIDTVDGFVILKSFDTSASNYLNCLDGDVTTDTEFEGVKFSTTDLSNDSTIFSLKIAERANTSSTWKVAIGDFKFKTDGTHYSVMIDDGVLS